MIGSPNKQNSYQKENIQMQNQHKIDKEIRPNIEEEFNIHNEIDEKLNNSSKVSQIEDQRIINECDNIDEDNNMPGEMQNENNNQLFNYFQSLRNDFYSLRNNVNSIRNEFHGLRNDVNSIRNEFHGLRNDVHDLSNDVHGLRKEVHGLSNDVHEMRNNFNAIFNNINLLLNNMISDEEPNNEPSENNNINYDEILEEKEFDEEANEKDKGEKCAICLENFDIGNKVCYLPCLHFYHSFCIKNWLKIKGKCPLCNKALNKNNN